VVDNNSIAFGEIFCDNEDRLLFPLWRAGMRGLLTEAGQKSIAVKGV